MTDENGVIDPLVQSENEGETSPEQTEAPKTYSEEEVAEFKKKAELADNYKVRAEKAETKLKGSKTVVEPVVNQQDEKNLSTKDILALIEAKVSTEDFDEVVNYASYRKVLVAEALKDKVLQTVLKEKAEERATANATNTRGGQKRSEAPTPDTLVSKAKSGQLPDNDDGIEELVNAEMALKRRKK